MPYFWQLIETAHIIERSFFVLSRIRGCSGTEILNFKNEK